MDVWSNYHTFDGNYCNPNYTNNKSQKNIKSSLAQYCKMCSTLFFQHLIFFFVFCEVINMNITYIIYKLHSYNKFIHSEMRNNNNNNIQKKNGKGFLFVFLICTTKRKKKEKVFNKYQWIGDQ